MRDPENSVRGGGLFFLGGGEGGFSHQQISQRAIRTSFEKQLDPKGPIASRGGVGVVPEFVRKPIVTCDFPGGADPLPPSLDPPMVRIQQHQGFS